MEVEAARQLHSPIKFEIKNGDTFMFKKVLAGTKAKQNVAGYTLSVINQTTDQFSLQQDVPFEGGSVKVVYNFERTGMK